MFVILFVVAYYDMLTLWWIKLKEPCRNSSFAIPSNPKDRTNTMRHIHTQSRLLCNAVKGRASSPKEPRLGLRQRPPQRATTGPPIPPHIQTIDTLSLAAPRYMVLTVPTSTVTSIECRYQMICKVIWLLCYITTARFLYEIVSEVNLFPVTIHCYRRFSSPAEILLL